MGLWNTRHINNLNQYEIHCKNESYTRFNSDLVASKPLVSIILPTMNRYDTLFPLLRDLEKQTYTNFELIIIDQSQPFKSSFYKKFDLPFRIIYQETPALWRARNNGIRYANSEYLLSAELLAG